VILDGGGGITGHPTVAQFGLLVNSVKHAVNENCPPFSGVYYFLGVHLRLSDGRRCMALIICFS